MTAVPKWDPRCGPKWDWRRVRGFTILRSNQEDPVNTSLSGCPWLVRLVVVLVLSCLGLLAPSSALAACNHNGVCNPNNGEDCDTCPDDCDPAPTIEVATTQAVVGQSLLFTGWGVADEFPSWNWGDGSALGYGSSLPHAFQQPGAYDVIFTGTDNLCGTTQPSEPTTIYVSAETCNGDAVCDPTETCTGCAADCDPLPTFTMSHNPAVVGQTVTFTGDQPAPGWDMGNQHHNLGSNPYHYAYPEPGDFRVLFTASDTRCGTTDVSLEQWIHIGPGVPICNQNGTCNAAQGEDCATCPSECGPCGGPNCNPNNDCDEGAGENCTTCPIDCDPRPWLTATPTAGVANHPIVFEGFGGDGARPGTSETGSGHRATWANVRLPAARPLRRGVHGHRRSLPDRAELLPVRVTIDRRSVLPTGSVRGRGRNRGHVVPIQPLSDAGTATVTVRNVGTTTWSERYRPQARVADGSQPLQHRQPGPVAVERPGAARPDAHVHGDARPAARGRHMAAFVADGTRVRARGSAAWPSP